MDLAFKTLLDFGNLMFEKNLLNWVRGQASLLEMVDHLCWKCLCPWRWGHRGEQRPVPGWASYSEPGARKELRTYANWKHLWAYWGTTFRYVCEGISRGGDLSWMLVAASHELDSCTDWKRETKKSNRVHAFRFLCLAYWFTRNLSDMCPLTWTRVHLSSVVDNSSLYHEPK